ncbi:MAG: YjhX family toxin [Pseudomonadota bacterium]
MNISKYAQRVVRVLAQCGVVNFDRLPSGKISYVTCDNRDAHIPSDCTLKLFDRLRNRRFIRSVNGRPYRATMLVLCAVNAQPNNK